MLPYVIRLRYRGHFARFAPDGRLAEWTGDIRRASLFGDEGAARAAIRGICAPEIRAAIRAGRAAIVRPVDDDGEETGEVHIVDAHDRYELYPTPMIRLDVGARFAGDDPVEMASRRDRGGFAGALVRELFREAPRLNWALQTKPRITPAKGIADEYTAPVSARARRAHVYGHLMRAA